MARRAAVGLDRHVEREQARMVRLDTQPERSRESVAELGARSQRRVHRGEPRASLARTQAQAAAASATTKRLATCQLPRAAWRPPASRLPPLWGTWRRCSPPTRGARGRRRGARAASALERAEQRWLRAEPALESCA